MNFESGSMISGKWVNPQNGVVINVVDTVIDENNNMMLITDKGSLSMSEFSANYVQCDDDMINDMTAITPSSKPKQAVNQPTPNITVFDNSVNNVVSNSSQIIKKLFDKIDSKPNININISWDDFPTDQINTLINFLDVKKEDISKYIMDEYLDEYSLILALNKFLDSKI